MRAGAQLLLLATNPINRGILRTVLERPLEIAPGRQYQVSDGGRELLFVAFVAERWLQHAPEGPIPFDSPQTEHVVLTMVDAWNSAVMHVLARGPQTFEQLLAGAPHIDRRELRHHLTKMQRVGQVEPLPSRGEGTIYAVTEWLQGGIAPLIASARLERRNPREGMLPIDTLDVEAGFRLSLARITMPRQLTGVCRLGLNLDEEKNSPMTGVTAHIDQGQVIDCTPGIKSSANAWAAGSANDWLDTVIEPKTELVRTGGDRWLTQALIVRLHEALFGLPTLRGYHPIDFY